MAQQTAEQIAIHAYTTKASSNGRADKEVCGYRECVDYQVNNPPFTPVQEGPKTIRQKRRE